MRVRPIQFEARRGGAICGAGIIVLVLAGVAMLRGVLGGRVSPLALRWLVIGGMVVAAVAYFYFVRYGMG